MKNPNVNDFDSVHLCQWDISSLGQRSIGMKIYHQIKCLGNIFSVAAETQSYDNYKFCIFISIEGSTISMT